MTQFQGATIQKAIAAGLQELQVEREQVAVDVIEEGRGGFLGFGRRAAIIDLKLRKTANFAVKEPEPVVELQHYLEQILAALNLDYQLQVQVTPTNLYFEIQVDPELQSRIIGHHGKHINALQTLVQEYAYYLNFRNQPVLLDSGQYRKHRQEALLALSNFKVEQVKATHKPAYLDPMPALERKIIYQNLAGEHQVIVRTQGQGLRKYLVLRPRRSRRRPQQVKSSCPVNS
ncbi:Jag N-terminal domain-containing protein [Lactobacillus sp. DCY120]|uniref:RNA-binding protein KhpB n=1 Tax=Bombilactobacillus apium TaxID=2675299 RepID=A0A850RCW3_9LACO|nr:RNA-binding cell elongation regulator Jag/EloR [Bombilactobacillus apium]NVY96608.1 Jag N-terminal domain-containing protein [Bombilactobacillus apium]